VRMRRVRTKMKDPTFVLTFLAALGCGLVAGIFFAFSSFVMRGLASVPPTQGIAAMQSINVAVLNRWFFAVFFGTAACCLLLAVASFFRWQKPGAALFTVGLCRASSPFDLPRSKTSSPPMSTILPHKPEEWPRVFEQHFDAGDLDAVMALYDTEAHFTTRSGETLVGGEAIRKVLGSLIKAKTQLHSRVVRKVTVGDVAQLYTDFEGTTVDSSGKTTLVHQKAIGR